MQKLELKARDDKEKYKFVDQHVKRMELKREREEEIKKMIEGKPGSGKLWKK